MIWNVSIMCSLASLACQFWAIFNFTLNLKDILMVFLVSKLNRLAIVRNLWNYISNDNKFASIEGLDQKFWPGGIWYLPNFSSFRLTLVGARTLRLSWVCNWEIQTWMDIFWQKPHICALVWEKHILFWEFTGTWKCRFPRISRFVTHDYTWFFFSP